MILGSLSHVLSQLTRVSLILGMILGSRVSLILGMILGSLPHVLSQHLTFLTLILAIAQNFLGSVIVLTQVHY
jgi:hypothetical protein